MHLCLVLDFPFKSDSRLIALFFTNPIKFPPTESGPEKKNESIQPQDTRAQLDKLDHAIVRAKKTKDKHWAQRKPEKDPVAKWRYTGEQEWRDFYANKPKPLAPGTIKYNFADTQEPQISQNPDFPDPKKTQRIKSPELPNTWGGPLDEGQENEPVQWSQQ